MEDSALAADGVPRTGAARCAVLPRIAQMVRHLRPFRNSRVDQS